MMTKNADKKREQIQMFCMDDMVPKDHMLRLIDRAIDWNFIYDLVEDKYCLNNGRPSMDPVMLIKIPFVQYLYGIKSMRQTIKEIDEDRKVHNKKPLKDKDDDSDKNSPTNGSSKSGSKDEIPEGVKTQKCSITDPESGWFRKGEHKHVFAYSVEAACDKFGWILGYSVHPGNLHDSRTFKTLYDKLLPYQPEMIVADAGYKTPAIAHQLLTDGIKPLFPYKRPMTKDGFFKKYEYAYDELYDCYICPNDQILKYSTTNRDGYREYKSCGYICSACQYLNQCTASKDHVKLVTRHVWEDDLETSEDIRYTRGNKMIYQHRKETIERLFGTAKEQHGFRYTQYIGKARMEMKVGLTFACMNLKKLAKMQALKGLKDRLFLLFEEISDILPRNLYQTEKWCWN